MKNSQMKRYRLEKLAFYDKKSGLETWKKTGFSSNDIIALMNFLGEGHRIFDTQSNKEVRRNVDLSQW